MENIAAHFRTQKSISIFQNARNFNGSLFVDLRFFDKSSVPPLEWPKNRRFSAIKHKGLRPAKTGRNRPISGRFRKTQNAHFIRSLMVRGLENGDFGTKSPYAFFEAYRPGKAAHKLI